MLFQYGPGLRLNKNPLSLGLTQARAARLDVARYKSACEASLPVSLGLGNATVPAAMRVTASFAVTPAPMGLGVCLHRGPRKDIGEH